MCIEREHRSWTFDCALLPASLLNLDYPSQQQLFQYSRERDWSLWVVVDYFTSMNQKSLYVRRWMYFSCLQLALVSHSNDTNVDGWAFSIIVTRTFKCHVEMLNSHAILSYVSAFLWILLSFTWGMSIVIFEKIYKLH